MVSIFATQVEAIVENLLSNHGFEDELTSWIVSSGTATYITDPTTKVSGSFSAKGVELFRGSLGKLSQDVTGKVTSGRLYQIGGWIKTQDVTGGGGAAIGLSWVDSIGYTPADGHIGGATLGLVSGTTEWTFYQSVIFAVPAKPADCVALYFSLDFSDAAGIAWWDDLSLTEVGLTAGCLQILEPINGSVIMGPATITFVIENIGGDVEFLQGDATNRIDLEIEYRSTGGEIYAWGVMMWSTSYYGLILHSGEKYKQTLVYDPSKYEGSVPPDFVGEAPFGEAIIRLVHWKSLEPGYWNVGEFGKAEIQVTFPKPAINASIDFDQDTLNLKSKGRWLTAHIELPEDYDVSAINISTVKLNGEVPAELHPTRIGDYDKDGLLDLMVKFDRASVINLLNTGEATLTITGEVDGVPFEGSDTIRVIDK